MSVTSKPAPRSSLLPASPFEANGQLFAGTRGYFDAHVDGGYQALLDALPPALQEFMSQPFLPGARYEVMLVPELVQREAYVAGLPASEYLRARTEWQAHHDLKGLYRVLLRWAPPLVIAQGVVLVMNRMFNFGKPRIRRDSPTRLTVGITRVPADLASWLEQSVAIYGQVALTLGGATHARCAPLPSTPAAPIDAYPTVDIHVSVEWD